VKTVELISKEKDVAGAFFDQITTAAWKLLERIGLSRKRPHAMTQADFAFLMGPTSSMPVLGSLGAAANAVRRRLGASPKPLQLLKKALLRFAASRRLQIESVDLLCAGVS
jgi:hypothetical protein